MRRSCTPHGGGCAPAPAAPPRRRRAYPELVPWTEICVEHLDLDQFDDEGNLVGRRYRAATAAARTASGEGR